MKQVKDVMDRDVLLVSKDLSVRELAQRLLDHDADGACVVEGGALVGVVTTMDLVFQEKNVHLPTMIAFLDAYIPIGNKRAEQEIGKITASDVGHIMSRDPFTARPDDPLADVATVMVERSHSFVPVVEDGAILGAVTRRSMLRAAAGR